MILKKFTFTFLLITSAFTAFSQNPSLTQSTDKLCIGDQVRLSAIGCDKKVVWSNGKTGASIVDTVKQTTAYTALCMEGENLLFNFDITLNVTAFEKPITPYLMCNKDEIKKGKSTTIKTFGCIGTVKWSTGETGREIKVSPEKTTTYTANCINEAGCSAEPISRTIIVYEDKSELSPTVSWRYGCNGEAVILKANGCTEGVYVWYKNTSILGDVSKNEEIGRGNEVEVNIGGNNVYYVARCQFLDCLGNESNRLQLAFLSKLDKPTVSKELFINDTQKIADLTSVLGKPTSSGGMFEFRKSDDITTTKLTDPSKISEVGTYYVIERSRLGNCVSNVAEIKVKSGVPTTSGISDNTGVSTENKNTEVTGAAPTEVNNKQTVQSTDTGATITAIEPNANLDELGIPGGFSPNGDGVNDVFVIKYLGNKKADLRVYNRYGHLVYEAKQYDNTWNGTPNTGIFKDSSIGLPDGTYYYALKLEDGRQRIDFLTVAR